MCCSCCVYCCTNVQSSWRHNCCPLSSTQKGDPNGPFFFYPALWGLLHLRLGQELLYVHIVHSTWRPNGCSPSSSQKETRTVPFFIQPCGAFYLATGTRTRAHRRFLSLDPGSTCKFVNIYPRPPVASYSNPKDSISSSPAFLYCIMCTCICFMLFRSTCSWPFSEENPLRVASEALNIHLVSCIL